MHPRSLGSHSRPWITHGAHAVTSFPVCSSLNIPSASMRHDCPFRRSRTESAKKSVTSPNMQVDAWLAICSSHRHSWRISHAQELRGPEGPPCDDQDGAASAHQILSTASSAPPTPEKTRAERYVGARGAKTFPIVASEQLLHRCDLV